MKIFVANFKSHQTARQAQDWINIFKSQFHSMPEKKVILAPSFTNLAIMKERLRGIEGIEIAAQDASSFPPGAYTGAVNAHQLRELGVFYCLVGHSERRRWFHETHAEIANKIRELVEQDIIPILCLDKDYLDQQIAALEENWWQGIIVAYEPLSAIGTGQPQDPEEAKKIAIEIRKKMPGIQSLLYGGAVTAQNAADYLKDNFDGLLIGTASLDPAEFLKIIYV